MAALAALAAVVMDALRTALAVAAKELRTSLRDRQTLVYMVVLPFAMYPVLFWVMLQGATFLRGEDENKEVRVGLVLDGPPPVPEERLAEALAASPEKAEHPGPLSLRRLDAPPDAAEEARLLTGREAPLDALVSVRAGAGLELAHDSTRGRSTLARERVQERVAALVEHLRAEEADAAGLSADALDVLRIVQRDVASQRDRGAYVFSLLLPMMFVFMGILGAFFPAVDVTAGEKERSTIETTWLLPVGRGAIHVGKVLAVTVAATTAAALNLLGMALAAEHLLAGIAGDGAAFEIVIPWSRLLALFPLGVVFLATTSAFLVAAASFTNTFKQGQSLLGSVQMVLLAPAFIGLLPGIELTRELALVPVVQTVLAFREILQRGTSAAPGLLALVAATQVAYALAVTWIAVRIATREGTALPGSDSSKKRKKRGLLARARKA